MEIVVYYATKSQEDLPPQRKVVKAFKDANSGVEKESFVEEYGPQQREWPILQDALTYCQEHNLPLIIARIGRLHLNPTMMIMLAQSGVEFVAIDNEKVNSNTIQILAASAQEQSIQRSQRTKASMDELKKQGVKLGAARVGKWVGSKKNLKQGTKVAAERRQQAGDDYYQFVLPRAVQMRQDRYKYQEIADVFNAEGLVTPAGKPYNEVSILRLLQRAKRQGYDVRRQLT